ncbi:MAG TPA: hypothetical protein VMG59_05110 [Phycisphaerae bacterium]|nr:hypothetical protein [Phycisphaerae bacterium]
MTEADYGKLFLSIIILSFGALMGFIFQDDLFLNFVLSLEGFFFSFPISLLVAAIAFTRLIDGKKIWPWLSWTVVICCSFTISIFVFYMMGSVIDDWNNYSVRSYVAHAAPILDKIKIQNGSYPLALPVSLLGEPPFLLRDDGGYSSDGQEFYFVYEDEPAGWAGGPAPMEFSSKDRMWKEADDDLPPFTIH